MANNNNNKKITEGTVTCLELHSRSVDEQATGVRNDIQNSYFGSFFFFFFVEFNCFIPINPSMIPIFKGHTNSLGTEYQEHILSGNKASTLAVYYLVI